MEKQSSTRILHVITISYYIVLYIYMYLQCVQDIVSEIIIKIYYGVLPLKLLEKVSLIDLKLPVSCLDKTIRNALITRRVSCCSIQKLLIY